MLDGTSQVDRTWEGVPLAFLVMQEFNYIGKKFAGTIRGGGL